MTLSTKLLPNEDQNCLRATGAGVREIDILSVQMAQKCRFLYVSYNSISSLDNISQFKYMTTLLIEYNMISRIESLYPLQQLLYLKHIRLEGNPICSLPLWYIHLVRVCPNLDTIDTKSVKNIMKKKSYAFWNTFIDFEPKLHKFISNSDLVISVLKIIQNHPEISSIEALKFIEKPNDSDFSHQIRMDAQNTNFKSYLSFLRMLLVSRHQTIQHLAQQIDFGGNLLRQHNYFLLHKMPQEESLPLLCEFFQKVDSLILALIGIGEINEFDSCSIKDEKSTIKSTHSIKPKGSKSKQITTARSVMSNVKLLKSPYKTSRSLTDREQIESLDPSEMIPKTIYIEQLPDGFENNEAVSTNNIETSDKGEIYTPNISTDYDHHTLLYADPIKSPISNDESLSQTIEPNPNSIDENNSSNLQEFINIEQEVNNHNESNSIFIEETNILNNSDTQHPESKTQDNLISPNYNRLSDSIESISFEEEPYIEQEDVDSNQQSPSIGSEDNKKCNEIQSIELFDSHEALLINEEEEFSNIQENNEREINHENANVSYSNEAYKNTASQPNQIPLCHHKIESIDIFEHEDFILSMNNSYSDGDESLNVDIIAHKLISKSGVIPNDNDYLDSNSTENNEIPVFSKQHDSDIISNGEESFSCFPESNMLSPSDNDQDKRSNQSIKDINNDLPSMDSSNGLSNETSHKIVSQIITHELIPEKKTAPILLNQNIQCSSDTLSFDIEQLPTVTISQSESDEKIIESKTKETTVKRAHFAPGVIPISKPMDEIHNSSGYFASNEETEPTNISETDRIITGIDGSAFDASNGQSDSPKSLLVSLYPDIPIISLALSQWKLHFQQKRKSISKNEGISRSEISIKDLQIKKQLQKNIENQIKINQELKRRLEQKTKELEAKQVLFGGSKTGSLPNFPPYPTFRLFH